MTQGYKNIAIPIVEEEGGKGGKEWDFMQIEEWPLIQACGLEGTSYVPNS